MRPYLKNLRLCCLQFSDVKIFLLLPLAPFRKLPALADGQHASGRHRDHRGWPSPPPAATPLRPVVIQLPRRRGLRRRRDTTVGQRAARSEWQVGETRQKLFVHSQCLKTAEASLTFGSRTVDRAVSLSLWMSPCWRVPLEHRLYVCVCGRMGGCSVFPLVALWL